MTYKIKKVFMLRDGALKPGGVEVMMLNTAILLNKVHQIEVVLLTGESSDRFAEMFQSNGLQVIRIPIGREVPLYKTVKAVVKACKSENEFFILQAHLFRESIIIRLANLFLEKSKTVFR
ncbi:MAG: hypothetical protein ACKOQ6_13580, partial [Bacteroidota bacterium]